MSVLDSLRELEISRSLGFAKSRWPNPQDSIGQELGTKGEYTYWEAVGPARDAYSTLSSQISCVLAENLGPVGGSDLLLYDIFLVGRRPEDAIPHIMFSCPRRKIRLSAVKIVKISGILKSYPGLKLGEWSFPPHIGLQTQRGRPLTVDHQWELFPIESRESNHTAAFKVATWMTGTKLNRVYAATMGALYSHGSKAYGLVPAHIFLPQDSKEAIEPEDDNYDDNDYSFDGFDDSSESGILSGPDLDTLSSFGSESDDSETICSLSDIESPIEPLHDSAKDFTSELAWTFFRHQSSDRSILLHLYRAMKRCLVGAFELDYVLVEVESKQVCNTRLLPLTETSVAQIQGSRVAIKVMMASCGLTRGIMSSEKTFMRLPYSCAFHEAHSITLDQPILPGDCGSIVQDDQSGQIYGHVVAGNTELRTGFIISATRLMVDITDRTRSANKKAAFVQKLCAHHLQASSELTRSCLVRPSCKADWRTDVCSVAAAAARYRASIDAISKGRNETLKRLDRMDVDVQVASKRRASQERTPLRRVITRAPAPQDPFGQTMEKSHRSLLIVVGPKAQLNHGTSMTAGQLGKGSTNRIPTSRYFDSRNPPLPTSLFGKMRHISTTQVLEVLAVVHGALRRDTFLPDDQFSCVCSYDLLPYKPYQDLELISYGSRTAHKVKNFALSISAVSTNDQDRPIEVVQDIHGEDGESSCRLGILPIAPMSYQDRPNSQEQEKVVIETTHVFQNLRCQWAKTGKGKGQVQKTCVRLQVELYANVEMGAHEEFIKVATGKLKKVDVYM